jgi:hypothetical protein
VISSEAETLIITGESPLLKNIHDSEEDLDLMELAAEAAEAAKTRSARRAAVLSWLLVTSAAFCLGFMLTYGLGNIIVVGFLLALVVLFGQTAVTWLKTKLQRRPRTRRAVQVGYCIFVVLGMIFLAEEMYGPTPLLSVAVFVLVCATPVPLMQWIQAGEYETVTVTVEND